MWIRNKVVAAAILLAIVSPSWADGISNPGASSITGGTGGTSVNGCSNTQVLFNNNGVIGCDAGFTKVAGSSGAIFAGGVLSVSGQIQQNNGTASINTNGTGTFFGGLILRGSPPVLTGTCTTATQTGGLFSGTFAATCTAQTVIMTFTISSNLGWACDTRDRTTPADTLSQISSTTNSATFSGTTVASDVIQFFCIGY